MHMLDRLHQVLGSRWKQGRFFTTSNWVFMCVSYVSLNMLRAIFEPTVVIKSLGRFLHDWCFQDIVTWLLMNISSLHPSYNMWRDIIRFRTSRGCTLSAECLVMIIYEFLCPGKTVMLRWLLLCLSVIQRSRRQDFVSFDEMFGRVSYGAFLGRMVMGLHYWRVLIFLS